MKASGLVLHTLLFLALTALTQVGGLVYLLARCTHRFIGSRTANPWLQWLLKLLVFILFYLLATFALVPLIASPLGRVRLPLAESAHLRPLNALTCLLNRNYVRPELREAALDIATQLNAKYPGTTLNYLDANFPFMDKFPLLPHLSHNDGKKLDLAFCYRDAKSKAETNNCPSFTGYGICEEPLPGEEDKPGFCARKGFPQYSILRYILPQGAKKDFVFDAVRTRLLAELCTGHAAIGKLFIEPHLVARLGLKDEKVRFHGCKAVRHDDHIHIQLQ